MRSKSALLMATMLAGAVAFSTALPVRGQEKPESILPPGFGDPEPARPEPSSQQREGESGGGEARAQRRPAEGGGSPSKSRSSTSSGSLRPSSGNGAPTVTRISNGSGSVVISNGLGEEDGSEEIPIPVIVDIPPQSRRSIAVIGAIAPGEGEMGLGAFQYVNGAWLNPIMRSIKAPIASRWASIFLRRALLSHVATPEDVNGADWAAERAALLVRMGESQAARALVQAVDVDQYSPRMFDTAVEVSLATADPAMLCGMTDYIKTNDKAAPMEANKATRWLLIKAMCAGLSGESGIANANLGKGREKLGDESIDVLLAEKVVGAGTSTKRSIAIEWADVKQLDSWRFGLASATGVPIPDTLYATVGPQVRAWQAQAPLLELVQRLPASERAAELGVFSSAGLVDLYSAAWDATDPAQRAGKNFDQLRIAYIGQDVGTRLAAMKSLWADPNGSTLPRFAGLIATARAAASLPVTEQAKDDAPNLIASMLTAGLDPLADRWSRVIGNSPGNGGWGLLAVGSQKKLADVSAGMIDDYGGTSAANPGLRAKFLFAGLAGLGRISGSDLEAMAKRFEVPIGRKNKWTEGLRLATNARSPGTVAVLAAAGLQVRDWKDVPPEHLYHIVKAMRGVGYEAEARMVAAEALMRV